MNPRNRFDFSYFYSQQICHSFIISMVKQSDKSEGKDFLDALMDIGFFQKYQEEMAERAENVTFLMKDGLLRMSVSIGYFYEVH